MIETLIPDIQKLDIETICNELLKGNLLRGEYLDLVSDALKDYIDTKYVILTNNGTSALHLILKSLNLKETDEIILPTLTFPATIFPIIYEKAKPILVDVDSETWNIDCEKIEEAITSNTKAIIPVDLYGNPCNNKCLKDIANDYNLKLIYDSAESLGSEYDNQRCGSFGDASMISFAFNKIVTSIEGGAILTNSEEMYKTANLLSKNCKTDENEFSCYGYNYRFNNIGAGLIYSQLQRIDDVLKLKDYMKRIYHDNLNRGFKFQKVEKNSKSNNWLISVLSGLPSKNIITNANMNGIKLRPIFKPLHLFDFVSTEGKFPNAEYIFKNGFSMPSSNIKVKEMNSVLDFLNNEVN